MGKTDRQVVIWDPLLGVYTVVCERDGLVTKEERHVPSEAPAGIAAEPFRCGPTQKHY